MRIIHTRKRVFANGDHAFQNKMVLLVWILSALYWKKHGNNTLVLYTDNRTLEDIKKVGFEILYDEINTDLFEDPEINAQLDFTLYWAMPKLLALRHEKLVLGNDCVISDQDVVPMSDLSRFWTNSDVTVWSNKEYLHIRSIYPELRDLSVPPGYEFPYWFTGNAQPLNTGVLHIKDKEIAKFYTDEVLRMSIGNLNPKRNTVCVTMCNVEQRLLAEVIKHKDLSYTTVQPNNKGLFNRNGFHTHGYKGSVLNHNGLQWHLSILYLIKKEHPEMFNKLINHKIFTKEREFLFSGRSFNLIDELSIYNIKKEGF